MSLRNLRTSAIVMDTCCFCLPCTPFPLGTVPPCVIQVELSISEPPNHRDDTPSRSGQSPQFHTVCIKSFSPSLWFAIRTPEESRFLAFRSSAIRRSAWESWWLAFLFHGGSLSLGESQATAPKAVEVNRGRSWSERERTNELMTWNELM